MDEELMALIDRELLSWPGISKETRGTDVTLGIDVTTYWLGRRQIGHIHHDGVADVQFPKALHDELIAAVVSYPFRQPGDVPEVLDLFRLSYDRLMARATLAAEVSTAAGGGRHRSSAR